MKSEFTLDLATATVADLAPVLRALESRAADKAVKFDAGRGVLDLWGKLRELFDGGVRTVTVPDVLTFGLVDTGK